MASHSVNSANEKVVEGQPKNEEKFKYASEKLGSASTLELEEELKVHSPDFFPRRLNFFFFIFIFCMVLVEQLEYGRWLTEH